MLLSMFMTIMSMMISIAFYTMMERKILSYIQLRKGPNKVGLMGLLQPFSDALKLFNKNILITNKSNKNLFMIIPNLSMLLSMMILSILPFYMIPNLDNKQNIITLFILSSMNVYLMLMTGWASNSKYAHLGAIRSIAQMISYELTFFMIILCIAIMSNSYYFTQIKESQYYMLYMMGNSLLLTMWLITITAELNRSPFDFSEGESELVSGFNVEFMGGLFAMIFLAEYANILIMSIISTFLFFQTNYYLMFMLLFMVSTFFLWMRGTLPRLRYDLLMIFNWKFILPMILIMLTPYTLFSIYMN